MSLCLDCGEAAALIEQRLSERFRLNREHYLPFARSERRYEVHKQFIDIQFVCAGREDILLAWASRFHDQPVFDEDRDIAFYEEKPSEDLLVHLRPGVFCVVFPFEAHMPCIRPDNREGNVSAVEKCVAKVPLVDYSRDPMLFQNLFALEAHSNLK
ncbi:MAG: YhcH/YjgK/YiaL family protein [Desulfovibrio sp.]|nr:YhcH/YjgK/YiaL family protein [Desulfovibrio sp.]